MSSASVATSAAEPGDGAPRADAAPEPARHLLQQHVADRVAERIVDALEMIEVEVEHREGAVLADATERARERLEE